MKIEIYTDGSATVATKPGGWAWVQLLDGVKHSEGFGYMDNASNNDAELEAAIQGLAAALKFVSAMKLVHYEVVLCSDSQIVLGWANGTYRFKQGAKAAKFEVLKSLVSRLNVKTRWVRGHSGDKYNEECDKLANQARKGEERQRQAQAEITANTVIGKKKDGVACFWYKDILKIIDLQNNAIEDYNKEIHGNRNSKFEVK